MDDIQAVIRRVEKMEKLFDKLLPAAKDPSLQPDIAAATELRDYYFGGRWQKDYELDEQGLLPKDLKRAVLSQDGLYDLFFALGL